MSQNAFCVRLQACGCCTKKTQMLKVEKANPLLSFKKKSPLCTVKYQIEYIAFHVSSISNNFIFPLPCQNTQINTSSLVIHIHNIHYTQIFPIINQKNVENQ